MKDFADDCGRIFSFSVFGYNKKLVEKIIDNNQAILPEIKIKPYIQ